MSNYLSEIRRFKLSNTGQVRSLYLKCKMKFTNSLIHILNVKKICDRLLS